MTGKIEIKPYDTAYKEKWDKFVLEQSKNGTVLQTKNFLDYHPKERFHDSSIMFFNGNNIIAVIPANELFCEEKKQFISHQGSTFGGLVIGRQFCKINYIEEIFDTLDVYFKNNNFQEVTLKQTSGIFQHENTDMLDYFLFKNGYNCSQEIGFYIDFNSYPEDIISAFSSSRRRDYRYSLKNNLLFKELNTSTEIEIFYKILCDNYTKFNKMPVHSLKELQNFKEVRLSKETSFYGVFLNGEMTAGAMVFNFGKEVFHTQYLAVKQDKSNIFLSEYLYTNIIKTAKDNGFKKLSFGTSTLEGGHVLNKSLALFKEGFGTSAYINRTYRKNYSYV